jgi:hypothetical protein
MKTTLLKLVATGALAYGIGACGTKETAAESTTVSTEASAASTVENTPATSETAAVPATETTAAASSDATFDLSKVPVSSTDLGQFPYLSPLKNYQVNTSNSENYEFERAYVYDGQNLVPIEGKVSQRLISPENRDKKASELMIRRNYEALLKDLGATKVYSGKVSREAIDKVGGYENTSKYGKWSVSTDYETDAYVVRQKDKEVWVQVTALGSDGGYNLTVTERAAMPQQASIIKADELKKTRVGRSGDALHQLRHG